jgi:hypothetical protein
VRILLLLVIEGIEMRFDGEKNDCRGVVSKVLLQSPVVHSVFEHFGRLGVSVSAM